MIKCADCGKQISEDDAIYCDMCGAPLCEDCGSLGFCSTCAKLWEVEDL